jgi:hypothetical protein
MSRCGGRTRLVQLRLALDEPVHPAVEMARGMRLQAGLTESLTTPEVLARVRAVLVSGGGNLGHVDAKHARAG